MSKKKNTQKKLIDEVLNQLMIQAERLGIRERYTPAVMEDLHLEATRKILTEFYMERSNLQYEMNMLGSDKKELLIKLERLNMYIRKAEGMREKYQNNFQKIIESGMGDRKRTSKAINRIKGEKCTSQLA